MNKTVLKWRYINGLKQSPPCLDFHITPVLTFARADSDIKDIGSARGICLEWGHWAFGFGVITVKLLNKKTSCQGN